MRKMTDQQLSNKLGNAEIKEIRNDLFKHSLRIRHFEDFLLSDVKQLRKRLDESIHYNEMEILKLNREITTEIDFFSDKFYGRIGNILNEIARIIDDKILPVNEKLEKISNFNTYDRDVVG